MFMDYSYPLLKKVFDHYHKTSSISEYYLVCCQHLLEPQLEMFKCLISFGFDPEKIVVLGKAYSSNKEVIADLRKTGINVFQPEFSGISFDDEHRLNCSKILEVVPKDAAVIILDDGGELIKCFAEADRKVLFAVEQTSSGFRKIENEQIVFPVVNVARSVTKLVQESPFVARLCYERIKSFFDEKNIIKPSILIVGLGAIGEAIIQVFRQAGFYVEGFDIKHGHNDLPSFIKRLKPDVVIGATGFSILGKADIEQFVSEKTLYFISVSSSDREFPVAYFRSGNEIHKDVIYKNMVFVNNGFPITFKGNRVELTPIEIEKNPLSSGRFGSLWCYSSI